MNANKNEIDPLFIFEEIRNNDLFQNINASVSDFENLKLELINLKKGEVLFNRGDAANSIYLVIKGEIILIDDQIKNKPQFWFSNRKFLGHEEYFLHTNRNSMTIAVYDSIIGEISEERLEAFINRYPSVLKNISNSLSNLDDAALTEVNSIIENKFNSILRAALTSQKNSASNNSERLMHSKQTDQDTSFAIMKNETKQVDLNKLQSGINQIIQNIIDSLNLLDKEKNGVWAALSEYETNNKKLEEEIVLLKDQVNKFLKSDKEKNELLGHQSYRIIELEKKISKFSALQSEYLQKLEYFSEQESQNSIKRKKYEDELKAKESEIANLDYQLKALNKHITELTETNQALTGKIAEKDKTITQQIEEYKNFNVKIENLNSELNIKEKKLTELNKDLADKSHLISELNNLVNKKETEKSGLASIITEKDENIKSLSESLSELQNKIILAEKSEKNNSQTILDQQNKIDEYDRILRSHVERLAQLEGENIKITEEAKSISEVLIKKDSEISELQRTNNQLSEEIISLNQQLKNLDENRAESEKRYSTLESRYDHVNEQLNLLVKNVEEKNSIIESKDHEISSILKSVEELKSIIKNKDSEIEQLYPLVDINKRIISESDKLKDEIDFQKAELISLKNAYDRLNNENGHLYEQLSSLKLETEKSKNECGNLKQTNEENEKLKNELEILKNNLIEKVGFIEEQKNEFVQLNELFERLKKENGYLSEQLNNYKQQFEINKAEFNNLLRINADFNKLKDDQEFYKVSIAEKDDIIKQQRSEIEELKIAKSEISLALNSAKNNFDSKLKEKDKLIYELSDKYDQVQKSLEEKIYLENQHVELIENQAQKIADFELLVHGSKEKKEEKNLDQDDMLEKSVAFSKPDVQPQSKKAAGLLSKFKVVAPQITPYPTIDNSFEHFEQSGIHILNVNLTRATMDVATTFNESLQDIINTENNKIIVNLLKCEFIDSSILGVLVSNLKKITAIGGDLRLVGFHPTVRSMMELTRVNRLFESFPSLEEAISSFN
ncbi:MAG: STAS domain-containing protein [Ignavibacteriaceae bacterium]|nr:STAS domain-containing protein [Ignavibacteriaceae bacterium]